MVTDDGAQLRSALEELVAEHGLAEVASAAGLDTERMAQVLATDGPGISSLSLHRLAETFKRDPYEMLTGVTRSPVVYICGRGPVLLHEF